LAHEIKSVAGNEDIVLENDYAIVVLQQIRHGGFNTSPKTQTFVRALHFAHRGPVNRPDDLRDLASDRQTLITSWQFLAG
jgi:hypothetical protein